MSRSDNLTKFHWGVGRLKIKRPSKSKGSINETGKIGQLEELDGQIVETRVLAHQT